ncbi:putative membrane protein [Vibrio cholerae HC-51A1]|nr:hypothetical protein [Vibrio sp. 1287]EGS66773.1 putative membrane protein [Vibrio cholerae HC-02A1]EKG45122.1 putative membrane protein [Vibrio cholerae HC-50A1]EKG62840.1 putative membrane protein [Vibrio cholerae HC-52A1]EKG65940.1 putative membrane protein [Vibrio cholerae HC-55A1]EKG65996.1 putative membrane protein [Vibrio cholerae HC-56A1]EKG66218.1 putative membrane protein [Vibrio cholerae HC-57A1]EKG79807.1 putative membrane protein [Vibrio paracholerae HE-16]EKG85987.1 putativ
MERINKELCDLIYWLIKASSVYVIVLLIGAYYKVTVSKFI